jgi:hypothetical protein
VPNLLLTLACLALGCANDETDRRPGSGRSLPRSSCCASTGLPLTAEEVAADGPRDVRELYPEYALVHARPARADQTTASRGSRRAPRPPRHGSARARPASEPTSAALAPTQGRRALPRARPLGVERPRGTSRSGSGAPPLDLPGRWVRLRLDERVPATDVREETLRVSMLEFPLPRARCSRDGGPRSRARGWRCSMRPSARPWPEDLKYRMRGRAP